MKSQKYNFSSIMPDYLFVDWHIFNKLHSNHVNSKNNKLNRCIYSLDSLYDCAKKFLELNYPSYIINIYGNDNYEFPYYIDIINYLANSLKEIKFILHLNGLIETNKPFFDISNLTSQYTVCFSLNISPVIENINIQLKNLLLNIGTINDNYQFCKVNIDLTNLDVDNAKNWQNYLKAFQQKVPFEIGQKFSNQPITYIDDFSENERDRLPNWCDDHLNTVSGKGYFCCGTSAIHITPDCRLTLGLTGEDQPYTPVIIKDPTFKRGMPSQIHFVQFEDAQQWLNKFVLWQLRNEFNSSPVRNPHGGVNAEEKLRFGLMKAAAVGKISDPLEANPKIWRADRQKLIDLCAYFDTPTNRDIFFGMIKARLLGDSAYLVDIPAKYNNMLWTCATLEFKDINNKKIDDILAQLKWSGHPFRMILPHDGTWIDILHKVREQLPAYELSLVQSGVDTSIIGIRMPVGLRYEKTRKSEDNTPQVSFVAVPNGTGENLQVQLDLILRTGIFPEFIIMLSGRNDPAYESAISLVKQYPAYARIYDVGEMEGEAEAFIRGLDVASLNYVCFLKGVRRSCLQEIISSLADLQKNKEAEVAVSAPSSWKYDDNKKIYAVKIADWNGDWLLFKRHLIYENTPLPYSINYSLDLRSLLALFVFAESQIIWVKCSRHQSAGIIPPAYFFASLELGILLSGLHKKKRPDIAAWLAEIFKLTAPALNIDSCITQGGLSFLGQSAAQLGCFPDLVKTIITGMNISFALSEPNYPHNVDFDIIVPLASRKERGLSLVVVVNTPVVEDAIMENIERISDMDPNSLECVLIDNSGDGETALILERYAYLNSNCILLRPREQCHPAECAKTGAKYASGLFLGFLREDEMPSQELTQISGALEDCDMHIFGVRRMDNEGITTFPFYNDEKGSGAWAAGILLAQRLPLELSGMFFKRSWLLAHESFWQTNSCGWEACFLTRVFQRAAVAFHSDAICLRSAGENYSASDFCHELESEIYTNLDKLSISGDWDEQARAGALEWSMWNIRENWLPRMRDSNFSCPESEFFMNALFCELVRHCK